MVDLRQPRIGLPRGFTRGLRATGLLTLAACGPATVPLEVSVELPEASWSLSFEIPAECPWPVMEIRRDGSVYLDGKLVATPGDEEQLELHAVLFNLAQGTPRIPDGEAWSGGLALPIVVAADGGTPYRFVERSLAKLRYRGVDINNAYLCVQGTTSHAPRAILVGYALEKGVTCQTGPETISRVDWLREAQASDAPDESIFRISRVDAWLPFTKNEPPPEIIEHPPLRGPELGQWLEGSIARQGLHSIDPAADATWQDAVSLFDLVMDHGLVWIGDMTFSPMLDVREFIGH